MNASMIVLVAMMVVTALIAVYRWIVAHKEDDFLHIEDPTGVIIAKQKDTARALSRIDHIGIALTVVTAFYAVVLVGVFLLKGLK